MANDPFRRVVFRGGGADIGVEIEPSDAPEAERQVLEHSLGNQTQLDMPLVSGELAADVGAVNLRLALHILFAAAAADGSHVLHPEVIRVNANGVNGLFEADFDFEPPAVEANDLQGVQGQIGAQEDHVAAAWVAHPDKADQLAQGPPQQVLAVIAKGDAGFPIDRTGGLEEELAVAKPVLEVGFVAIDAASATALAATPWGGWEVSDGVGAHTRDQVVTVGQERACEFGGGVIGVGDDGQGASPLQSEQQAAEFIQQGAPVAGAPNHALVNAGSHWDGQAEAGGLDQEGDGLQGMAHDEGRLGIAAGLLVKAFYGRHFATLLGSLEAIDHHNRTTVDLHEATTEQMLECLPPELG